MPMFIKMKLEKIEDNVEIPEKTEVKYENGFFIVKGPNGEIKKRLSSPPIGIDVKEGKIRLVAKNPTKREKKTICSFKAHLRNMIKGVNEKYVYTLKICSGHFPMSVSVKGDEFTVKNFFGESVPRVLKIKEGAEVKIDGDKINVEGIDKELAGQVSADIENLTRRTKYDRRIFQDGIYIISKAGKEIK